MKKRKEKKVPHTSYEHKHFPRQLTRKTGEDLIRSRTSHFPSYQLSSQFLCFSLSLILSSFLSLVQLFSLSLITSVILTTLQVSGSISNSQLSLRHWPFCRSSFLFSHIRITHPHILVYLFFPYFSRPSLVKISGFSSRHFSR